MWVISLREDCNQLFRNKGNVTRAHLFIFSSNTIILSDIVTVCYFSLLAIIRRLEVIKNWRGWFAMFSNRIKYWVSEGKKYGDWNTAKHLLLFLLPRGIWD